VTTIIFTFIGTWNALEWPLLVTFSDKWRPISYGLYAFTTEAGSDINLLMAASVITLVPVLIIYLIAQRQFTEGIATTGLKG
jgi:ABC-type glycerol-3-phosphate transport system permease component